MELKELLNQMTPEIYRNMKESLELSRWPNGERMSVEQRDATLQALIAWEYDNLPEEERTGYMPVSCKSADKKEEPEATILRFKD